MKLSILNLGSAVAFLLSACVLAGCGGTKVLKESQPIQTTQPLAAASDEQISVALDWVIVRDGPGTWARNADWDEYLLRVNNLTDDALEITSITLLDSLGTRIDTDNSRRKLVKGARKTKRRYKDEGLEVRAGAGAGIMVVAGTASFGAGGMLAFGGSAVGAAGLMVAAPVLAVGGVLRGVNNSKVNKEIETRQTLLSISLQREEEKSLDIFFPLTPSPRQVELTYVDSQGEHTLVVDTLTTFGGLHLVQEAE
jgi:hypothetical protein